MQVQVQHICSLNSKAYRAALKAFVIKVRGTLPQMQYIISISTPGKENAVQSTAPQAKHQSDNWLGLKTFA